MINQPQIPKIEKGIQIPERKFTRTGPIIPILQMEIGDSMFVPESLYHYQTLQQNLSRLCTLSGRKYPLRRTTENGVIGVRIWRDEDDTKHFRAKLKIDKGIPVFGQGKWQKLLDKLNPLINRMNIGESFMAECPYQTMVSYLKSKFHNYVFASRKQPNGNYRFWRLK